MLRLSFEGVGSEGFAGHKAFGSMFMNRMADAMHFTALSEQEIINWKDDSLLQDQNWAECFEVLDRKITNICRNSKKPIVVMIDEVDKSSDNQIFLDFLGLLRNKYLKAQEGFDDTFHSVILAGVYDIKNLKLKLRPSEERKYNSPWNIAADFKVDMSFSVEEIATMLQEYEDEHHTDMDVKTISQELYFFTSGYPFLVSRLCKWIDEDGGQIWTTENIRKAESELLHTPCTLFDDLVKNYENDQELQKLIDEILFSGKEYAYVMTDPVIQKGVMFGILKRKDNLVAISNVIFDTILYNHVMSKKNRETDLYQPERKQFIQNGRLNMPHILEKFQELMKSEYRKEDERFLEQQGRLLFLCFLKPIINGTGFYYVEPETRNSTRMDIVVAYGGEEHVIELKLWFR